MGLVFFVLLQYYTQSSQTHRCTHRWKHTCFPIISCSHRSMHAASKYSRVCTDSTSHCPLGLLISCQQLTESGWDSSESGQTLFHVPPSLQFVSFPMHTPALPTSALPLSLPLLLYTMRYSTMSFKKHADAFPAEAETASRSIVTQCHTSSRDLDQLSPSHLRSLLDAKYI